MKWETILEWPYNDIGEYDLYYMLLNTAMAGGENMGGGGTFLALFVLFEK